MSPGDWGMSVGISNEYIQANLLRTIYPEVYTEPNDIRNKGFNTGVNITGYDFIFRNHNKFYKVQCKLRQTRGIDTYSCQVSITTSRRRGNLKDMPYKKDDFDFAAIHSSYFSSLKDHPHQREKNLWKTKMIRIQIDVPREYRPPEG